MSSMPTGVKATASGLVVASCLNEIVVLRAARVVSKLPVSYEPSCVAIHPNEVDIAVGGAQDHKLHIYKLCGDTLEPAQELAHTGPLTDAKYSPDGAYLVGSDANRRLIPYSLPDYTRAHKYDWGFHSARVNCVAWAPDSRHVASGGVDTVIFVWNVQQPMRSIEIKAAHPMSQVTQLVWVADNTLLSTGQDSCIRQWTISYQ